MNHADFHTDADVSLPPLAAHHRDCGCALHARRRFGQVLLAAGATAALPALAQQPQSEASAQTCKRSSFSKLVSAEQIEEAAALQYRQLLQEAQGKRALASNEEPQLQRLREIGRRLVPFTTSCNPDAQRWRWEVNLIGSRDLNAFCMPGGKIAFFYGILQQLQLSDDEVATIMGHEMAHALLEHARERMGKTAATRLGAGVLSAFLGLGSAGDALLSMGGQLLTLRFSREDESEADVVGLEIAARGGYDPRAGISLWQKMLQASKGSPPPFLSTHPSGPTRIRDIEGQLPRVLPIFERAAKPQQRFGPPAARNG